MYDSQSGTGYSFSPEFLILDKNGNAKGDKEPVFPSAPRPAVCLGSTCTNGTDTPDPRTNSGSVVGGSLFNVALTAAIAVLASLFMQ